MNTDTHSKSSSNQLSEDAREIAHIAEDAVTKLNGAIGGAAEDVADATMDAARRASDKAKEMYESAKQKAGESLEDSKAYVRRNPVPVVLGAIAFGAALGCLVMMARRKPTFLERYAEEPMDTVRDTILGAIAPVTQRVHRGYDSARDGAERAMERVHKYGTGCGRNSLSGQISRFGNNLKFW